MPRGDKTHTPLHRKGPTYHGPHSNAKMPRAKTLAAKLCRCIKWVRIRAYTKKEKEKAAIGICITSVLHSRGKTVKQFHCRPSPYLRTQSRKSD